MATADPARIIIDAALELAETSSWEAVRLYDVAAVTGMTLDEVRVCFREKDELIDAWFDRADRAMLQDAAATDFLHLSTRQRLYQLIICWLDALAAHRRVTRQMILEKCEPGHLHIQLPAIMRISRTVQWLREAAQQDATHLHRALEETALTGIYLTTFIHWLNDNSPDSARTRQLLDTLLAAAEAMATWLSRPGEALSRPRSARGQPKIRTTPS